MTSFSCHGNRLQKITKVKSTMKLIFGLFSKFLLIKNKFYIINSSIHEKTESECPLKTMIENVDFFCLKGHKRTEMESLNFVGQTHLFSVPEGVKVARSGTGVLQSTPLQSQSLLYLVERFISSF